MIERKQHRMLALILAIFMLPWLLAVFLFHHHYVGHTNAKGTLISPHQQLSSLHLKHCQNPSQPLPKKWMILYILPKTCGDICKKRMIEMKQFQQASGKYQDQITLILLTDQRKPYEAWCLNDLQALPKSTSGIMIADPLGQIILKYDQTQWQKPAMHDLKHVMRWSKTIG